MSWDFQKTRETAGFLLSGDQTGFSPFVDIQRYLGAYSPATSDVPPPWTFQTLQPFFAYITKTHTTFGFNTESTYDWRADAWSVPINIYVQQLLKVGPQIFQVTVGARYWATAPSNGPEGWGWRAVVTLLYPK